MTTTCSLSSTGTKGVQRVPAGGGLPVQVTSLDSATGEVGHHWPDFLPDGKHFIYYALHAGATAPSVHVASIDGGPAKRLFESPASARVAWPNRLLFMRDGALLAQPFDLDRLELSGEPVLIANDVPFTNGGRLGVSASRSGVLVLASGGQASSPFQTAWVDRTGRDLTPAPPTVMVGFSGVRLSPDGSHLAYGRSTRGQNGLETTEVWVQDVARGVESRISKELPGVFGAPPVFLRDGASVVFAAPEVMLRQVISGAAPAQPILKIAPGVDAAWALDVSPDGTVLLAERDRSYVSGNPARSAITTGSITALRPGAETSAPFVTGLTGLGGAAFSPDGRWVAHATGTASERQVFIQLYPDASAGKWQVSGTGG
jgi:hypothetical protein